MTEMIPPAPAPAQSARTAVCTPCRGTAASHGTSARTASCPGTSRTRPKRLRNHLKQYGTGRGGHIFTLARGGILTDRAYLAIFGKDALWHSRRAKRRRFLPGGPTTFATPPCPLR